MGYNKETITIELEVGDAIMLNSLLQVAKIRLTSKDGMFGAADACGKASEQITTKLFDSNLLK